MGSICKTTTTCLCHVHAMSDLWHLEAGCDTQTFELAVMQKKILSFSNNFGSRGGINLSMRPIVSATSTCDQFTVSSDQSPQAFQLAVMQNKFFVLLEQFWYSGWVRYDHVRYSGSAMYICGRVHCIANADETPRHSNLP